VTALGARRTPSVSELQAALLAARRGDFAEVEGPGRALPEQLPDAPQILPAAATVTPPPAHAPGLLPAGMPRLGSAIVVIGAHPGVGASTVAVAIADAAAAGGSTVGLAEVAPPGRSGLAEAATSELGPDRAGLWIVGRRGGVEVRRLMHGVGADRAADALAAMPPFDLAVVDAGCSLEDLGEGAAVSFMAGLLDAAAVVVVCRATVPSIRRAELSLGQRAIACPVLAVLGPARLPGSAAATAGPAVRALIEARRVIAVPVDGRLQLAGVTSGPLPKPVAAAGLRLHRLLSHDPAAHSSLRRTE
jgi:hypothetical protein